MADKVNSLVIHNSQTILSVGTEWFSKKGGLSTFNRQLCITLARTGHEVYCYLPEYGEDEYEDAKQNNVSLLTSPIKAEIDIEDRLFQKPPTPPGKQVDIIIGHDIITGSQMSQLKHDFFTSAKTILFIHTVPGETDWHKPEQKVISIPEKIDEKERKQKKLSNDADLVAAVGPHLFFETQSLLSGMDKKIRIVQFDPGLSKATNETNYSITSLTPEALLIGRIEDFSLKGVDIAVKAMHKVHNRWDILTNGFMVKPKIIIRGSAVGTDEELIKKLREIESSKLRIQPKNYNPDIDVITEDIRKAAVVLMPSRAEGFGLIGLEAISNGRPVLISEASGLAMLLNNINPDEAKHFIVPGKQDDNIDGWAEAIYNILKDRPTALKRIEAIAKSYSAKITWEKSVGSLLNQLEHKQEQPLVTLTIETNNSKPVYLEPGVFRHNDGQFEIRSRKFDFFSSRMAYAFPGLRELSWITDPTVIIERLKILLANPLAFTIFPGREPDLGGTVKPIWWFRGGASMFIDRFTTLSESKCLIGWHEFEVDRMAIYRGPSPYREFVYIRTKAETPAHRKYDVNRSINNQMSFQTYATQEYAIYKGSIITREEYDDGAALIDGKPAKFTETPELRVRHLTTYNFIITVQSSVYNSSEADRIWGVFLDEALRSDNDDKLPALIDILESLDSKRAYMLDFD